MASNQTSAVFQDRFPHLPESNSTLTNKLSLLNNTDEKQQQKMLKAYQGLDKSFYNDNRKLEFYLNKGNFKLQTGLRKLPAQNITYAGRQLQ